MILLERGSSFLAPLIRGNEVRFKPLKLGVRVSTCLPLFPASEGIFLYGAGVDPYSGGVYHEVRFRELGK